MCGISKFQLIVYEVVATNVILKRGLGLTESQ